MSWGDLVEWQRQVDKMGWRGPALVDLAARFEAIGWDPDHSFENFLIPLICGNCGRRLDLLGPGWDADEGVPVVVGWTGNHWANGVRPYDDPHRPDRIRISFPGIQRSSAPRWGGPHALRYRWICHKRCRADYPLRVERVTEKYLEAMEKGRSQLIAGIDL